MEGNESDFYVQHRNVSVFLSEVTDRTYIWAPSLMYFRRIIEPQRCGTRRTFINERHEVLLRKTNNLPG